MDDGKHSRAQRRLARARWRADMKVRLAEAGVGAMALFMTAVALWGLGALLHAGVAGG